RIDELPPRADSVPGSDAFCPFEQARTRREPQNRFVMTVQKRGFYALIRDSVEIRRSTHLRRIVTPPPRLVERLWYRLVFSTRSHPVCHVSIGMRNSRLVYSLPPFSGLSC